MTANLIAFDPVAFLTTRHSTSGFSIEITEFGIGSTLPRASLGAPFTRKVVDENRSLHEVTRNRAMI